MGEENFQDQKNIGEIYPGKLLRVGTGDPIGVDNFITRNKEYGSGTVIRTHGNLYDIATCLSYRR